MFNWYSVPAFAAMALFWMLAAYILTRSPRRASFLLAAAAQVAAAAFLLGQGMQANATSLDEWRSWARGAEWSTMVAPTLWYWVTALLLREQPASPRRYLRWVGFPLGAAFAMGATALAASSYFGDALQDWSAPVAATPFAASYFHFHFATGPLYPVFVGFVAATTAGAAANLGLGARRAPEGEPRRHFLWLTLGAILFVVGAVSLAVATWLVLSWWPVWLSHLLLGATLALMAINVAAYSLLLQGQVMGTDFLYFLTASTAICLAYAAVLLLVGGYSFKTLELTALTVVLVILSHALVDVARRGFDWLFFGRDVRRLRADLTNAAQSAALAPDLGPVLNHVGTEIAEIGEEHFVRLTEQALRRLNNPASLAKSELIREIPHSLASIRAHGSPIRPNGATPLEQAQALREVLSAAIERLKPPEGAGKRDAPGALQHHILREEYLLGLANKHIMIRHSISEGTFHRNRRDAIAIVARELRRQEDLLARAKAGSF